MTVEAYRVAVAITADASGVYLAIDRLVQSFGKLREAEEKLTFGFSDLLAPLRDARQAVASMSRDMESMSRNAARVNAEARGIASADAPTANGGAQKSQRTHGLHELGAYSLMGGLGGMGLLGNATSRAFTTDDLLHVLSSDTRISPDQVRGAYNAAYTATISAPGTKLNTNLEALIDLTNVTGSLDEATSALPAFAKMSSQLQTLDRKHGGSGDQAYAASKAMDVLGEMIDEHFDPATGKTTRTVNPALMQKRLDEMTRVAVATNDKVSPYDYLNFAKQARVAGMTLSDEFIYEKLPAMMQTMGGQRAGTAMMSIAQVFKGGAMTDKTYDALAAIGLATPDTITRVQDPKTHRWHKVHHNGHILDTDLLGHDPLAWMQKAQERMDAAGIHGTEAQITALMRASQRSTIAGMFADLLKDMPAILRDQEKIRHTDITKMEDSASAHMNQLSSAWDRFLTVTGNANTGTAIAAIDKLTSGLNALSSFENKHPNLAKDLTMVGVGLSALAVGAGALALAMAPFKAAKSLFSKGSGALESGASAASPITRVLGRTLSIFGLGYEGYSLYQDTKAREAETINLLRSHPKEAQQAQWLYDHSYGMFGLNMKAGQAQPATQVNVYVDGKQIAAHVEASQERRTRQDMRASGTAPDLMQYAQYPGRSVGN
ncbi:phage tail tape measure protein [Acetobacter lambici]|uniref:Phage tail tape measure protein domain-containing protein n=1 Tax=Acetobacter lambici TaxID=1332824 RepID=A0ABT1F139_9PROT|nr:hypothetical protein [Acetobacter lambici]MCP1242717.1 hypothetical protein [Acetobacter lambici]MCP1258910.1 hypothetical protein [Acetobacter lambici]